jgi:hypothetical protein
MTPEWLYKPIVVDNLTTIQQEFQTIVNTHYTTMFDDWKSSWLYPIDRTIIEQSAPTYITWLKELKLYDRWATSFFATSYGTSGNEQTVHIDNIDYKERCFSLNIPILNCEDSWTVWYKTKENSGVAGYIPHYSMALGFSELDIEGELGRMPATQPAFINVGLPHRPWSNHVEPRIILSTRFNPEIFDYLN